MRQSKLNGKAWVFGDLLDVDWEIFPYETLRELRERGVATTEEELGKYCMTTVAPDFPKKVRRGDFIVGGENTGYGHDHDHACISIKGAGVAAVICESTNGNFFRNSVHHGLPVVDVNGIKGKIDQGDEMEVSLSEGTLRNLTSGKEFAFPPYPDLLLKIVEAGGLYPYLKERVRRGEI
ncbi:MAG: 3-isopropylmalate dehydratase [Chloroflexota bacterium]